MKNRCIGRKTEKSKNERELKGKNFGEGEKGEKKSVERNRWRRKGVRRNGGKEKTGRKNFKGDMSYLSSKRL